MSFHAPLRRPPNRAGTNTEHGMPIDGDLSHLLVSSMIAMPGSPKSPDQRRTGPGKSPTAKLVPGKGNPVRELVHGERESFIGEYRRQPRGPAVGVRGRSVGDGGPGRTEILTQTRD